eukprot:jgi/Ulvmu1/8203/UM041_0012.1
MTMCVGAGPKNRSSEAVRGSQLESDGDASTQAAIPNEQREGSCGSGSIGAPKASQDAPMTRSRQRRQQAEQSIEVDLCPNQVNDAQQHSWSSMLFMPSGSCQVPVASLKASAASPSASLPYPPITFPTHLVPPKPDANGSALGIPVPLPVRSTSACSLPPMPAVSTSAAGGGQKSAPQYRKVFVPSTVIHNGVAQQMLVPMMCMVAPLKQLQQSEHGAPAKAPGSLPPLPIKRMSSTGTRPGNHDTKRVCRDSWSPCTSPEAESLKHTHYRSRASGKASPDAVPKGDRLCDTGALSLLADAALMDL